jgi:predicted nucleic acid-binding Zn finger protein
MKEKKFFVKKRQNKNYLYNILFCVFASFRAVIIIDFSSCSSHLLALQTTQQPPPRRFSRNIEKERERESKRITK